MHATHGDFIALVDGLPATSGTENLEETLKTELQKATSQEARLHCSLCARCANISEAQSVMMLLPSKDLQFSLP